MSNSNGKAKIVIGHTVSTRNVLEDLNPEDVLQAVRSQQHGNCGELCEEDRQANEVTLEHGERLFSVYHDREQTMFYIITEWDRT